MRCEEVEELAGAYALGALDAAELSAVEVHLSGCDKHPEIAEFVATARAISLAAPEMDPPTELKTRLMAAVHADLVAERVAPAPRPEPSVPKEGWLSRLFASPRGGFALAGAVAAIVAVLIVTNPFSRGGDEGALVKSFESDGVSGELTYIPGEDSASITLEGMDRAPEGHVYQVWAITDGAPDSIGFLYVAADGTASSEMQAQLAEGQVVAITVEPAPGSQMPTTDPILRVQI